MTIAIRRAQCRIWGALFAAALSLAAAPAARAQDEAAVVAEMTTAANALIEATGGPQFIAQLQGVNPAEALRHDIDGDVRTDWSYWPREREGLAFGFMDARQRIATHDLLASLLSARGYLEVQTIFSLEDVLAATERASFPRGIEYYAVAIFGEPGGDAPWGWRLDGHHVALNVTVAGNEVAVTPSFLGSNPARVTEGDHAGLEALRYETRAAAALLDSLDAEQKAVAVVSEQSFPDILSGQLNKPRQSWDDWKDVVTADGLAASDMTADQRALLDALVDQIVARYRPEIAEAERAKIDADAMSFAWMGPTDMSGGHYFRLVSGDFVYEYDAQGDGNHIHTVWRNKSDDFGAAILARHYATDH